MPRETQVSASVNAFVAAYLSKRLERLSNAIEHHLLSLIVLFR